MKILAPVDGSKASLKAIKHACNMLASAPQFSVTLMSVHDDIALKHARSIVGSKAVDGYLQELSDKDLASARKLLDKAGVKHEVLIRSGHIAQEIVTQADEGEFDLIVMGNKGRSALRDLLIGSVAQRVLALAKTPVLLVK